MAGNHNQLKYRGHVTSLTDTWTTWLLHLKLMEYIRRESEDCKNQRNKECDCNSTCDACRQFNKHWHKAPESAQLYKMVTRIRMASSVMYSTKSRCHDLAYLRSTFLGKTKQISPSFPLVRHLSPLSCFELTQWTLVQLSFLHWVLSSHGLPEQLHLFCLKRRTHCIIELTFQCPIDPQPLPFLSFSGVYVCWYTYVCALACLYVYGHMCGQVHAYMCAHICARRCLYVEA